MYWIDKKYAGLIGHRQSKFRVRKQEPYLATFRCPYCGDSEFSKNKTRGYFLTKSDKILFFCHNCGKSITLGSFIKEIDPVMYSEYRLECFKESKQPVSTVATDFSSASPIERFCYTESPLLSIKKISSLAWDHPAKKYVEKRKIPSDQHYRLYYAPQFTRWVNEIFGKDTLVVKEHPRLILPLIDEKKVLFGFQGRSFDPADKMRYMTYLIDNERPKVFGLDVLNRKAKDVFVLEGPIDSLFIRNSLAMAGADVDMTHVIDDAKDRAIFVYDNEPRNKDIVKRMNKAVERGYRVVVFPPSIESKDINDMIVKEGYEIEEIPGIISRNTYSGIEAKLKINEWKR